MLTGSLACKLDDEEEDEESLILLNVAVEPDADAFARICVVVFKLSLSESNLRLPKSLSPRLCCFNLEYRCLFLSDLVLFKLYELVDNDSLAFVFVDKLNDI